MSVGSFDVAVMGGGPIGGHAAGLVAKAGHRVAIIEEHEKIGEPIQCAGLISPRCLDIVPHASGTVLNRLNGAEIRSPSGGVMRIGRNGTRALVIDRAGFDRSIIEKAQDSGARLISGERVKEIGVSRGDGCKLRLGGRNIHAKLIIGADGARSLVRRTLGLGEPEFMLNGINAEVTGLEMEQDRTIIFFGREVAPNFFAWMIPAGDIARVGLCVRGGEGTAHDYFKRLFRAGASAGLLKGAKILRTHSGLIPLGSPSRTYSDRGMIVGDAACQVKATSGGGIYPGLVCARHCADAAIKALENGDCSEKALAGYQDAWKDDIGEELDKALMIHRVYSSLSDSQLEDIFGMLQNPEIQAVINEVGDIDYPSRLGWMLLRKEPGLLKYAGKFLRHGLIGR